MSPYDRPGRIRIGAADVSWMVDAECRGMPADAFFVEPGSRKTKAAVEACSKCQVRAECLEYAIETNQEFGIWAGLAEVERRRYRKRLLAKRLAERRSQNR